MINNSKKKGEGRRCSLHGYSYVRAAERETDQCFSESLIHRAAGELGCRIVLHTPSVSFFPFWGPGLGGFLRRGAGCRLWPQPMARAAPVFTQLTRGRASPSFSQEALPTALKHTEHRHSVWQLLGLKELVDFEWF